MFERMSYKDLNGRQQENYNFHKVAAWLADYGFNCHRLSDDWKGADFIAYHMDGERSIRIQLKGRLTIDDKYMKKSLYVAFPYRDRVLIYDHDKFVAFTLQGDHIKDGNKAWHEKGSQHWPRPPEWALPHINKFMRRMFKDCEIN